jgi:murein DD-endopeptidase MepM/ murein hydrolase activator NlpD
MHLWTDPRLAVSIGWALVHFIWQGALLALVTAIALRLLRSARARYLAACASLALCLLLPAGTALRNWQETHVRISPFSMVEQRGQESAFSHQPAPRPTLQQRLESAIRPRLSRIVLIWTLGCIVMGLRLFSGWLWTLRWRRRSLPAPEEWQAWLQDLTQRLMPGRRVRLLVSQFLDSPITVGFWKPVILVPSSLFTGMSPELLEALLAHELAHIQRYDYLINWIQSGIEVLLFYHPAVWWISRRIRTEREFLADERAAMVIGEPRRLALALNALDDLQPHLISLALAARGGHLMNRIHRLLRPIQNPRSSLLQWVAPALLAAALISPLAAAIVQDSKQDTPKIYAPTALVEKIDTLAKQEGIDPDLLRAIAQVESHYNPGAVSTLGAKGILQVLPETALKFGAKDLSDPDQVAQAGARYLRHLLDVYQGDWTKAVAAYNGGENAVNSEKLSDETRAYVPQVMLLAKAKAVQPDTMDPNPPSIPKGLPLTGNKITQDFGATRTPGGDAHPGIDLKGRKGDPVHATADGTVLSAGPQGPYGITVMLQHGNGVETLYAHLNEVSVKPGQRVTTGTVLGTVGNTGNSTKPHLHYEVRKSGQRVDPKNLAALSRQNASLTGELRATPNGELDLQMKFSYDNGVRIEITEEGESKPVARLAIGSRDEKETGTEPSEAGPTIRFKPEQPGKPLCIRYFDHAGRERGKQTVETTTLPMAFRMYLLWDTETQKN